MYKLIIADDEPIIRQHLLKAINWESIGFEIIAEASDGLSLFNKTVELCPDAVLIDIKMPIMSGIEFSKKIREINPGIKIVVLSGYADSEYLLDMISSGVFGYILKPFKNDKLSELFTKLRNHLDEEALTNTLKNTEAIRVYLRDGNYENFTKCFSSKADSFQIFKIYFDELPSSYIDTITENTFDCLEILVDNYYILEHNTSGILCCIPTSDNTDKELIQSIFLCINDTVSLIYPNASVSMCYIPVTSDWKSIRDLIKQFDIYQKSSFLIGSKSLIDAAEVKSMTYNDNIIYSKSTEDSILHMLSINDTSRLTDTLSAFHNELISNNTSKNGCKQSYFHLVNRVYHSLCEQNVVNDTIKNICSSIFEQIEQFCFIDSLYKFIYNLFMEISENLYTPDYEHSNMYFEQAISYIDKNFKDDITLAQLANALDISYGYLSSIFKLENNTGFVKLLRKRRITEAKKLLRETSMKIYEISSAVGFSNERYFSAIFKKETGFTPLKYRLKYTSNTN